MYAIKNCKILKDHKVITGKALLFDEKIIGIVDENGLPQDVEKIIDANDQYVAPGFIDLHIHGYDEKDTMDGTVEAVEIIAKGIASNGVTSFLPTTMTMSKEQITTALEAVRVAKAKQTDGAEIIGVHMEGPYVNVAFKGAQNSEYIIAPTQEDIDYVKSYSDIVKLITVAPEIEGANAFIKEITATTDIKISMGHTAATYEQAMESIGYGVSHTTHLFNAMLPLHHRNPGVIGAALSSDISCEMICDTIHVNPGLYQMVIKAKEMEKFVLVTDCMCAGGCKEGEYALGGQKVIVEGGSARLLDGTLAGSTLKLNEALKNIIDHTNYSIEQAIDFATINPARVIGLDHVKGSLEPNKDADLIIMDEACNVKYTFNKGRMIYENN